MEMRLLNPESEIEVRIAPMRERDLEEILSIEGASFSCPWTREMFRHELAASVSWCFVAKERQGEHAYPDAGILGYICCWMIKGEMQISNLAVHPTWRRRGIGGALLGFALRFGRRRGAKEVFLEVRASNTVAQRLYQGLGFKVVGRRKGYYQFPPEDALIMALDLAGRGGKGAKSDLTREGW